MPGCNVKLGAQIVTLLSKQVSKLVLQCSCPDNPREKGGGELPLPFLARLHSYFPPGAFARRAPAFRTEGPKDFDKGLPRLQLMPAAHQPDESGKWNWSASVSEQLAYGGCFNNRIALARFDLGTFGLPRSNIFAQREM